MGVSVDVNSSNFSEAVVTPSYQQPVLVDFFAQWCGPCQLLKPMLEKLAQEYNFVLAKIDIDSNPDIANACKVEGVPDVRVVSQGKMYQGFVGVLPEPKLREFLARLNFKSGLETSLESAQAAAAAGNIEVAKQQFTQLLQDNPQDRKVAIAAAQFLISQDELGEAERLLASVDITDREYYAQSEALGHLIQLKLESQRPNGNELDDLFAQSMQQTLAGDYQAALPGLLSILSRDRRYREDGARKAMLAIFALLGHNHPLVQQYRKQLTATLY